jgi:hypothetical protein
MGHISFQFKKFLWSFYTFLDVIFLSTKVSCVPFPYKGRLYAQSCNPCGSGGTSSHDPP